MSDDPAETTEVQEAVSDISLDGEMGEMGDDLGGAGELDADGGGEQSIADRLLSTEPNPPLEQVESPWNPEQGGIARIYRGVQKVGDVDGLPAIADIAIGVLEHLDQSDLGTGDDSGFIPPEEQ